MHIGARFGHKLLVMLAMGIRVHTCAGSEHKVCTHILDLCANCYAASDRSTFMWFFFSLSHLSNLVLLAVEMGIRVDVRGGFRHKMLDLLALLLLVLQPLIGPSLCNSLPLSHSYFCLSTTPAATSLIYF